MITTFTIPKHNDTDDVVTVEQQIQLSRDSESKSEMGRIIFRFSARCLGCNNIPKVYKTGSEYPYDVLLYRETIIVCGDCGTSRVIKPEK